MRMTLNQRIERKELWTSSQKTARERARATAESIGLVLLDTGNGSMVARRITVDTKGRQIFTELGLPEFRSYESAQAFLKVYEIGFRASFEATSEYVAEVKKVDMTDVTIAHIVR